MLPGPGGGFDLDGGGLTAFFRLSEDLLDKLELLRVSGDFGQLFFL